MAGVSTEEVSAMGFTEEYIAAWNSHDEDTFLAKFAPDSCYTDVTMQLSYPGESEIRRMFRETMKYYKDLRFVHESGFSDDRHYVVEWTSIAGVDGTEYSTRAVSVGDIDDQGRILENRDYWNPGTFPSSAEERLEVEAAAYKERSSGKS
jgi:steroid delta-isomerase-like uncharacterized protein